MKSPERLLSISIFFSLALLSSLLLACSMESDYVLIDQSQKAYTSFTRVPEEQVEAIRAQIEGKAGIIVIPWRRFISDEHVYLAGTVLINEYPESDMERGLLKILEKHPGVPVGVTWNGGMAITTNDYRHAERTYQQFVENPDQYRQIGKRDPRADPLRPESHFGPLLGW